MPAPGNYYPAGSPGYYSQAGVSARLASQQPIRHEPKAMHLTVKGDSAPFVVFDADVNENIAGPYATREEAETERQTILARHRAAQALVADPGVSRLLTEWRQP